jgi:hypothetical protein
MEVGSRLVMASTSLAGGKSGTLAILMGQGLRVQIPHITAYAPYGHNRIVHIDCLQPCAEWQDGEGG